ncbi:hypothetical protein HZB89_02490 [archaeon]|nr:hypothetical protein [archaeon]
MLDKNQPKSVSFSVKNKSSSEQSIDLLAESSLSISLPTASLVLAGNETKTQSFNVSAVNESPGLKSIKLIALNQGKRVAEHDLNCLSVKASHSTAIDAGSLQGQEISKGMAQLFGVKIANNGDETEDYNLSVDNNVSGLEARFVSGTLSVPANSTATASLLINPGFNASAGLKSITVKAKGKSTASQSASFTILSSITVPGQIEFTVYPKELSINAGEEKTLIVKVKNAKENELNDLFAGLSGAGNYLKASQPAKQMHIAFNEEKTIYFTVKAVNDSSQGEFDLSLEASSQGITEKKTIKLFFNKPLSSAGGRQADSNALLVPSEFSSSPSGFISLGGLSGLGIPALIILIFVAFIYFSKKARKPETQAVEGLKAAIDKIHGAS